MAHHRWLRVRLSAAWLVAVIGHELAVARPSASRLARGNEPEQTWRDSKTQLFAGDVTTSGAARGPRPSSC